ncbi:aspartate aminotransferase family protein [Zobellia galactanivorans]|uniref:Acetylornithine aminotransferase n=1 Tax=Zobellia galactanivorans (strain DSM 12802 / CCUG 47099 / CIP 106680 / NCIMB 13871 / Dsij) TaxID=63186 RepID=G0L7H9_ZOBGA|nr:MULTISPECIES: aspartate aminotransferase family protein [Zobellia]MDO6807427.1 aspartate aminotransferase family protein [Zobellia galactanivorans]OWW24137.1 aspartate aminotransferase family protein [Zobellia sp. OII3]CAZ97810.1 Acetylornithine aminotransferase [Zobellia galactanivorans]
MKEDFLKYQAQTSPYPLALPISHAKGSYIYDTDGKAHLDFVAGVSACSLGHCHPKVVEAVQKQAETYMHVMVYGEYIQEPAVAYTKLLASLLPPSLETTYMVNSGTEAVEGAMKLARRATGRSRLLAARHAYHGNTMGSLSVMGYEERKSAFRPLIPDVGFIRFNNEDDLDKITDKTAAVILETIQGGAGFIEPTNGYLKKVRQRCNATGTMLILDEIQPGFGRTGKLFAFEHYDCVPDILVMGKGMASGLPVGAFTASKELMSTLQDSPKLGHITTFGGNPVIASACLATLKEITETQLIADTLKKEALVRKLLKHRLIKEIRGKGLMLALIMENAEIANHVILNCAKRGLILFWLLFEPRAVRISPPLTMSTEEIESGCGIILEVLEGYKQ